MARYLFDADAVIDYFNDVPSAIEIIDDLYRQGDLLCTCSVVIAELYAGLLPVERARGQRLLDSLRFLSTSPNAARQAGVWRYDFARRGRQLSTTDCLIGAVAVEHRATLVTGNVKDYPMAEVSRLPLPRGR
jgi:tRNA(fMet)-specific endonuclease VapC